MRVLVACFFAVYMMISCSAQEQKKPLEYVAAPSVYNFKGCLNGFIPTTQKYHDSDGRARYTVICLLASDFRFKDNAESIEELDVRVENLQVDVPSLLDEGKREKPSFEQMRRNRGKIRPKPKNTQIPKIKVIKVVTTTPILEFPYEDLVLSLLKASHLQPIEHDHQPRYRIPISF